jgi:hypothetical protein
MQAENVWTEGRRPIISKGIKIAGVSFIPRVFSPVFRRRNDATEERAITSRGLIAVWAAYSLANTGRGKKNAIPHHGSARAILDD